MLWGDNQVDAFSQLVKPGYTDCVLGMNEYVFIHFSIIFLLAVYFHLRPNQEGQANISTDDGAKLWNTYIAPLASQGYTILGSPAPTSAPDGLAWINEWLDKIQVKPTVMCLHWYDVGFANFQQYVTNYHNNLKLQRNIWVTEFACQNFNGGAQCSQQDIWDFVTQATAWMDGTPWIEMYAPFGVFRLFHLTCSYTHVALTCSGFMRDMQGVNQLDQLMKAHPGQSDDGYPTDLGYFFINQS